jgi:protein O-mannosyl-transferase
MSKRKKLTGKDAVENRPGTHPALAPALRLPAAVGSIILCVVLAYLPSLNGGFVLDDDVLLTGNGLIKASDGLYRFWFGAESYDYWPASNSTLWIEWRLWKMHPAGYHATNLVLHIISALLIWIILRKLSIPGAFLAALIFAVHPVNVESAAWIASRKNLIAINFFLLSILWYLKFLQRAPSTAHSLLTTDHGPPPTFSSFILHPSSFNIWYWLSLSAFILAMLGKGSAAFLPIILLAIVWWMRKITRWDMLRTAPFFLAAAVLVPVNIWFQTHGAARVYRSADFIERMLGAGGVVWFYLYKAILPLDLSIMYPQWHIRSGNLTWWLPLIAAAAITAVLWRYRRSWGGPFLFAWFFFCAALTPVLGFADVGFMQYSLVADRYQHMAIIAVIALTAAGWSLWRDGLLKNGVAPVLGPMRKNRVAPVLGPVRKNGVAPVLGPVRKNGVAPVLEPVRRSHKRFWYFFRFPFNFFRQSRPGSRTWATLCASPSSKTWATMCANATAVVVVCTLIFLSRHQAGLYSDAVTFYRAVLEKYPNSCQMRNNLGIALVQTGRTQDAIDQYKQALQLKRDYPESYNNLGDIMADAGRWSEAIDLYRQAIRFDPEYFAAYNNLGNAFEKLGRIKEAIDYYRQAVQIHPQFAEAHYNLGNALSSTGGATEAIEHYEKSVKLNPDFVAAYNNLGMALVREGRFQEAIDRYQQALRIKPDFPEAHNNLGIILNETGRTQEAIDHYQQALRLKPDYDQAFFNLAIAYAKTNRPNEADTAARKALVIARSKGQAELVRQIEEWLNLLHPKQIEN